METGDEEKRERMRQTGRWSLYMEAASETQHETDNKIQHSLPAKEDGCE